LSTCETQHFQNLHAIGNTYDAANRLTQLVTPDGTSNYTYNNRDELTGTDHSYQSDETYSYDATGNRTNHIIGDHNRILDDGTYTYQYDNEGNRTRRVDKTTGEITQYTWDHRNRLTEMVTQNSAGTVLKDVDYTYDVYDRRIAKSIDADGAGSAAATQEHLVYDGDHIALVFDSAGNETHRYLHGPQIDQVLAEETANGATHWALSDHQNSVRDIIDNQGTVLNHLTYDSYGQVISESNPAFDFRFGYTGRERDEETGLMYYRARYFDPAVGTFISEDPLGFGAGDANIYRYVGNSPTNFIDPLGLDATWNDVNNDGVNDNSEANSDAFIVLFLIPPLAAGADYLYDRFTQRPTQVQGGIVNPGANPADYIRVGTHDPAFNPNYRNYNPPIIPSVERTLITVGDRSIEWCQESIGRTPPFEPLGGFGEGLDDLSYLSPQFLTSSDPLDLVGQGWYDVTHPQMERNTTSREFINPETSLRVRFDKGDPNSRGYDAVDHYHVYNPDSTGNRDLYLDANGNPVHRGANASHILPSQMHRFLQ
jgi:RHS repeat-associated protein